MKRILFMLALSLLALFGLAVALNAPRLAEARAHEAAARAMQTQAVVTGLAVSGLLLVVVTLLLLLTAVLLFFLWGVASGRLLINGERLSADGRQGLVSSQPMARYRLDGRQANAGLLDGRRLLANPNPHTIYAQQLPTTPYPPLVEEPFDWRAWENQPWDVET
jgi:hypothetical protein